MRRLVIGLLLVIAFLAGAIGADGAGEIVVAMRYLKPKGVSHAHLYLYREDGKLLRQLTRDDSGQDRDPIFSPDGSEIVFSREKSGAVPEYWRVGPEGNGLRQMNEVPDWYRDAKTSPHFDLPDLSMLSAEPESSPLPSPDNATIEPASFRAPDGSCEIIFRRAPDHDGDNEDDYDQPGHGRFYVLRNLNTGDESEFGKLPGYLGASHLLVMEGDDQNFLLDGPLRVVFFGLHLNSTDGDTVFALDLNQPRFVRLSPNWASPFPLPGEAAFLTYADYRYVPIPGSHMTANCSFIERWDAQLQKVRYARPETAALCYGACLFRPGKNAVRTIIRTHRDAP